MPFISKAAYARHRGCSAAAVTYAVKEGRITVNAEGMIDPEVADREWERNSRARAPNVLASVRAPAPPPAAEPIVAGDGAESDGIPDIKESRARKEAAEADLAELKARKERGLLIEKAPVVAAWAKQTAAARDAMLNIPDRMAPILAAESDPRQIKHLLDAEIRAAMNAFAEGGF